MRDGRKIDMNTVKWLWGPNAINSGRLDAFDFIFYWSHRLYRRCFTLLPVDFDTLKVHVTMDVVFCNNTRSIALCIKGK